MTLKNIEMFVDATPEGEQRIDYAATLAHQCGAHVTGIHVVSAVRPEYRFDYYVIGEKAIRACSSSRKRLTRPRPPMFAGASRPFLQSAISVPNSG
jgi:hypothetical protein